MVKYIPDRGDAVWLDLDPQKGHEQAGRRPAFVITPASYNTKVGLALFCPITPKEKGYPFEVKVPDAFEVTGVILSDRIKSLDWQARNATFICKLPQSVLREVCNKLKVLLPE